MNEELIKAFYDAARHLRYQVRYKGWRWSSNYIREHVRCSTGLKFTNSLSPAILREVVRRHPEMAEYIELGTTDSERCVAQPGVLFK